jgi:tryptophan synthase alpha chain
VRIDQRFASLRAAGRAGLVAYVTAGDPSLERSAEIVRAVDRGGADLIEIGVPFSDPVADGPVIERAAGRALGAGGSLRATLDLVERVRADVSVPLVLFTYVNPVLRLGLPDFVRRAAGAGVDGVLVLDLPVEEASLTSGVLAGAGIDMIFLISPTTSDARIARAASLGRGFLYAISRLGVTGARSSIPTSARGLVERARRLSALPVAVGFGISTPAQVADAAAWADAVVVGSAIVSVIERAGDEPDLADRVERFVRSLATPLGDGRGGGTP